MSARLLGAAALLTVLLGSSHTALGQCQLQKLIPSDLRESDQFGDSVAVSGDWMVVGASRDDEPALNSGSVTVFSFDGIAWTEWGKLIPEGGDGASNDLFGWSVSIDAFALTGPVIVAGAQLDDDIVPNGGSAYVFRYSGSTWTQEAKITTTNGLAGDEFGTVVSVSGDMVAVGAPRYDGVATDAGAICVFTRSGSSWNEDSVIQPSDVAASDRFGSGVAVDATIPGAERVIGGAILHDLPPDLDNAGGAWIFESDGNGGWNEEKLIAPFASGGDKLGQSVDIAGDIAIVSVHLDDDFGQNSGQALIFSYLGGSWNTDEPEALSPSDPGNDDQFGRAVSLSEDGYWAVVGSPLEDGAGSGSGAAYLYEHVDNLMWVQVEKLVASDALPNDEFGTSVALALIVGAPENAHIAIGASKDDDPDEGVNAGSAYIFTSAVDECSDCNNNLIPDINEIIDDPSVDCNNNTILDVCEIDELSPAPDGPYFCIEDCDPDCNDNGIPDSCDVDSGLSTDQNLNGVPDECEDCNGNQIPDEIDILDGAQDCNDNQIIDSCELDDGLVEDCDENGIPDECDLDPSDPDGNGEVSNDCDGDGRPDECDDCNGNGIADSCDVDPADPDGNGEVSLDTNSNGIPDECEDCNSNGLPDFVELITHPEWDCNQNDILDVCEIDQASGAPGGPFFCTEDCNPDCNDNGIPDDCDIADLSSDDENGNGVPDECEDCNENGIPDSVDIDNETSNDCDSDGIPDECEIHFSSQAPGGPYFCVTGCAIDCNDNGVPDDCDVIDGTSDDCDENGVPDECEADCNENGINDTCDIADGTALDLDGNGVPDTCDPDCDDDGFSDFQEILFGIELDCNENEIPDSCDIDPSDPDGNGSVSEDTNGDGIPDECNPADLNGDGTVGFSDLLLVLGNWGTCSGECPEDLDGNGDVGFGDLIILLAAWDE